MTVRTDSRLAGLKNACLIQKSDMKDSGIVESPKPHRGREYMKVNAVRLGREGGKKGGQIRAVRLSASKRREIARKAAKARWAARSQE
jgi:hypothetical protein